MRLILFDRPSPKRFHFDPLALSRPIWDLRIGMSSLGDKLIAKTAANDVACFVPDYMAEVYRETTDRPVNDANKLAGDDLLLVHGRVRASGFDVATTGASQCGLDADGEVLWARIAQGDLARLNTDSIDALLASVTEA
ncbi:MAG: hypothetical protein IIA67_09705, partial [Planctomycetes bacterium]|nr:hypothetical protein [Planctomycetota bacterium]